MKGGVECGAWSVICMDEAKSVRVGWLQCSRARAVCGHVEERTCSFAIVCGIRSSAGKQCE